MSHDVAIRWKRPIASQTADPIPRAICGSSTMYVPPAEYEARYYEQAAVA